MAKSSGIQSAHLEVFAAEFIGTAVLLGLSLVILMFGSGSRIVRVVPSEGLRRLITGFFFGATGALIALSPVGKVSGAHINPVVTLGVRLMGRMQSRLAAGYIVSQFVGATAGALHLSWVGVDSCIGGPALLTDSHREVRHANQIGPDQ